MSFRRAAPPARPNQYTLYGRNLPGGQPAEGLTIGGVPLKKLPVNIPLPADEAARDAAGAQRLVAAGAGLAGRHRVSACRRRSGPANPVSIYFAKAPTVVVEQEPNNEAEAAQKIAVPCEVVGPVLSRARHRLGRVRREEGADAIGSRRFRISSGWPAIRAVAMYRVKKNDKGEEQLSEIAQVDDLPERGRRNPATDEFDATSDDPAYKFVVPEDGTYRLLVRDQFGDGRKDPSFVYRLAIRDAAARFPPAGVSELAAADAAAAESDAAGRREHSQGRHDRRSAWSCSGATSSTARSR